MLTDTARRRLEDETHIWMTTIRHDGQPQSSVVWFLLDGDDRLLVYSKKGTVRNENVRHSPRVAFNLDGNGRGGAVVTIEGIARIDETTPAPADNPSYLEKYSELIASHRWTPESFGRDYPVPIVTDIERVRSW